MSERSEAMREWRGGWQVVFASLIGMTMLGMGFASTGTFMPSLEQAFHWSRAELSSGLIVYAFPGILLAPLVGVMLDRWGARRVGIFGALAVGASWALFATNNGSYLYWLFLWLLFASATQFVMMTVWSSAVSTNFRASRGLALSVAMMGNGVTSFLAPVLSYYLIAQFGWRLAFVVLGLGWGGLVALVCFFMLHDRRKAPQVAMAATPAAELSGYSVRDGIRSGAFIRILVAVFICSLLNLAMSFHLVPMLKWDGLTLATAVWVASALGPSAIAGKALTGLIADRLSAKWLGAFWIAVPAVTCLLLLQPTNSALQRMVAVILFGLASGSQLPLFLYLSTRHFGMRHFGTLFSIVTSGYAVANSIAPPVAGWIFDHTHGYAPLLMAGIPLSLLASLIILSLGRYPQFEAIAAEPVAAEPLAAWSR